MVVHACHSSDGRKHEIVESWSRQAWAKTKPYLKKNRGKIAGVVAQALSA
jgi:hypothetical protein